VTFNTAITYKRKTVVLGEEPAPMPLCLAQIASPSNPGHTVEEAAINGLTYVIALVIDNTDQIVHFPQTVLYSDLKLLYASLDFSFV
jgi:hypothetical protein